MGFIVKRNIEVAVYATLILVRSAPIGLFINFTESECNFFGRSDAVTVFIHTETNLVIAVRRLNLPDNRILTVISVYKAFPDIILCHTLAGTCKLRLKPVFVVVVDFQLLCLLIVFEFRFQP